jgi:hypothetical protein
MAQTVRWFGGGDPTLTSRGREMVRVLNGRGGITKVLYVLECDTDGIAFWGGGNDDTLMSGAILEVEDDRVSLWD